jgi:hypothetical protein
MSHLPLRPGDDITIFLLAPHYPDQRDGLMCYPTERYAPIGFPILAEYDDDVQVRKIRDVKDYTIRYLHEFAPVYIKKGSTLVHDVDGDHEVPLFDEYKWDDLEDFVRDVIYGQLYVDRDGKKLRLEHVMMHTDLYYDLIANVADRIPYGQTKTLEVLLEHKILTTIEWLKDDEAFTKLMQGKYGINAPAIRRFSDRVHIDTYTRWKTLDRMAQYYIETENGLILDDIMDYILWNYVMNYSRYGYHCISGGGSQCQEMMLQKIIAEFILDKCESRKHESAKDYQGNVLEETMYWWAD